MLNLCTNAQEAMPQGGVLTVEAANMQWDETLAASHPEMLAGTYVRVTVHDTGIGMDEVALEHVFEPFFTTKELGRGTGLGLSTVYGIVRQHRGFISARSRKDQGSTFEFFLPAVEEEVTGARIRQGMKFEEGQGKRVIMVVEDNDAVRVLTCEMLKALGYQVLEADSSERCIALLKDYAEPICMLLSDVVMPKMNGKELYNHLLATRPDLKVLFMSGYTSDVIGHHGVVENGVHFIQKPFSMKELSAKLKQVMG